MNRQHTFTPLIVAACALVSLGSIRIFGGQQTQVGGNAKVEVYVVPFSHLDRFWGGTSEECLARGNRIIAEAIQIIKQHPNFRFFLESDNFVANFLESHRGTPELTEFQRMVKQGQIEIAPEWAGIFQEFPPGEVLARNLIYGKRYARGEFGVNPRVDALSDIPGFSPQFPQLLREAGIPFMVMTRMGPRDKSLFKWEALDGSAVMVWNDLYSYCWGAKLDLPGILATPERRNLEKQIERVRATAPGPIFMSSGCDLWAPTPELLTTITTLNQELSGYHFILATPQDFFERIADASGLPILKGEIPSGWPMVGTSVVNLWQYDIPATNVLLDAEEFSAINYALGYAPYPQRTFDFLWKRLITSMDHNHDGQGGRIGDATKKNYSELAIQRGGLILRHMLRNIGERVRIPVSPSVPIVVFNPTGWKRNDLVKTHLTIYGNVVPGHISDYKKGIRLVDDEGNAVPFQVLEYRENISRALEVIFVARGVPSLGYKTYFLVPSEPPEVSPDTSEVTLDQAKDQKNPRRPLGCDTIENEFYRVTVDKANGGVTVFDRTLNRDVTKDMEIAAQEERGSHYVGPMFLTGRTIYASVAGTQLEENNPVRTVYQINEQIDGIPIIQRLVLYKELKRLDIVIRISWKPDHLLNVQMLIPLEQPDPEIHYGVAFGANSVRNVIPGSGPVARDEIQKSFWQKYRVIHGWISAGNSKWSLTVSADHQVFELGPQMIRADMIRGTRYTSVKVVRETNVTSMKYPPPGVYTFRYSLTSGPGDWKANRSYEQGRNWNNPLIPVEVVDNVSSKFLPPEQSFCSVHGDDLIISSLKKSDVDGSVILRLYEVEGRQAETRIRFLGQSRVFGRVNLLGKPLGLSQDRVLRVKPYQIVTVKLTKR